MTTSTFDLNSASNSNRKKIKRVGAAFALALVASVAGLSAMTSSAHASGWSMRNGLGGYDYHFSDGSSAWSMPNGLGGYDYF
ncbi:hypothetical protein [Prochlorococcus sp. MIT 1307]|uniref:hypothetical protein n=1 Tax=Prochlorococcus sp. MIT 1307 TaxID=3096219 RepID=UPI002A761DB8|nr:hypothetical protein [Prochlorococcus sp. MIT 1307]